MLSRYIPKGRGGSGLTCGELLALSGALSAALPTHMGVDSNSVHSLYSSLAKGVKHFSAPSLFFSNDLHFDYDCSDESCDSDSEWSDSEDGWNRGPKISWIRNCFSTMQNRVKAVVDSKFFQRAILFAILVNTLSMGVEYHDQVS